MLKDRLFRAIPLTTAALLAFLLPGWYGGVIFLGFAIVFSVGACLEFFDLARAFGPGGYTRLTWLASLALLGVAVGTEAATPTHLLIRMLADAVVAASFVFLCFLAVCREGISKTTLLKACVSIAAFFYIGWFASFLPKLYFSGAGTDGRFLVLYILLVTKFADTGAYAMGTATARRPGGNHKLVPRVSPKKSWEGLIGGTLASLAAALFFQWLWADRLLVLGHHALTRTDACIIGIGASLVGLVGDLAESVLKRAAGAKDSGHIAGLGGILDMLDSLFATAPLFYAYIYLKALL